MLYLYSENRKMRMEDQQISVISKLVLRQWEENWDFIDDEK